MIQITVKNKMIWFHKGRAFLDYAPMPFCNYQRVRTLKTARRMARGIIDRFPDAIVEISTGRRGRKGTERYEIWTKGVSKCQS